MPPAWTVLLVPDSVSPLVVMNGIYLSLSGEAALRAGSAADHDASRLENIRARGQGERAAGVLLHEQDGHALGVDAADHAEDLPGETRGEAERRLVEEQ